MFSNNGGRAKTAPSHYPRLPFHILRTVQFVSSVVVAGIMIYFVDALVDEHYAVPWTFIFLLAASILSICALAFTMLMHCCIGLNPRLNLVLNGGLSLLWGATWSVLTWYMKDTLAGVCNLDSWGEEDGVMICKTYKALFSFTFLGFLSTLAAFCLDVYVRRRQTRSGIYRLHDIDQHGKKIQPQAFPAGLQFSPASNNPQGYTMPEGQYRYDTAYQPGYHH